MAAYCLRIASLLLLFTVCFANNWGYSRNLWALDDAVTFPGESDETPQSFTYVARDSLNIFVDESADANLCLQGLCWEPDSFSVINRPPLSEHGDRLIQFPSALPSGNKSNDLVFLEWSVCKNEQGEPQTAPAIVIVHESGSQMNVGRLFARSLRHLGFHTFMIQLPYYGHRRSSDFKREELNQISSMRQAIADVRRARDAVAVLPFVDNKTIALQGTSLGGFVAASAASLDGGYNAVFLMLAGGDLFDILQHGEKDAAKARERLARQGLTGDRLKEVVQIVEPTRIAHRLPPQNSWLYSGLYDKVVPQKNALLLARSIQLEESHHIRMPANHYSGVVFLPMMLTHIQEQMQLIQLQKNQGQP